MVKSSGSPRTSTSQHASPEVHGIGAMISEWRKALPDRCETRRGSPRWRTAGVARFGVIDRCHKPQMRNLRRTDTLQQFRAKRTGAPSLGGANSAKVSGSMPAPPSQQRLSAARWPPLCPAFPSILGRQHHRNDRLALVAGSAHRLEPDKR
jgi:hypothetical protein